MFSGKAETLCTCSEICLLFLSIFFFKGVAWLTRTTVLGKDCHLHCVVCRGLGILVNPALMCCKQRITINKVHENVKQVRLTAARKAKVWGSLGSLTQRGNPALVTIMEIWAWTKAKLMHCHPRGIWRKDKRADHHTSTCVISSNVRLGSISAAQPEYATNSWPKWGKTGPWSRLG